MLPTFLVIGAKKAGSTSLFRYARDHPQVFMPEQKHLDFFSGATWDRGVGWYEAQFAGARTERAIGEASNSYTERPGAAGTPARVASVVPEVRLVYLIRHPIARITSHYRQAAVEWGERRSIDEVVAADPGQYLGPCRYANHIERYLERFSRDQLLVMLSEDLRDRRLPTLHTFFSFIGVDPTLVPPVVEQSFNRGGDHRAPLPSAARLRRSGFYRAVRRVVPPAVRDAAWRATSRAPVVDAARAELSPVTTAEVLERLRPDLQRLRHHLGPSFNGWGLLGE